MRTNEKRLIDDYGNTLITAYRSILCEQKREYLEHHHTECELSLFIKGSGVYSVGGRSYTFKKGDVFLFASNEAHCITEISEEMELLNFHFEPKLIWEHTDSMELLPIFTARAKGFCHRFPSEDSILTDKIRMLDHELQAQPACCLVNAKYLLFSILVHLIRTYGGVITENAVSASSSAIKRLKKAMLYIDEHLSDQITLQEVADSACLTPTYFSAIFKKYNGVSLWRYITIKRVELAIAMLKNESLTKLEIAEKCGFTSSSNFYKAFAKVTGKTPSDFTKKYSVINELS